MNGIGIRFVVGCLLLVGTGAAARAPEVGPSTRTEDVIYGRKHGAPRALPGTI
jgi:hypothetical protein